MADNYIEKRMEDYRRGNAGKRTAARRGLLFPAVSVFVYPADAAGGISYIQAHGKRCLPVLRLLALDSLHQGLECQSAAHRRLPVDTGKLRSQQRRPVKIVQTDDGDFLWNHNIVCVKIF